MSKSINRERFLFQAKKRGNLGFISCTYHVTKTVLAVSHMFILNHSNRVRYFVSIMVMRNQGFKDTY